MPVYTHCVLVSLLSLLDYEQFKQVLPSLLHTTRGTLFFFPARFMLRNVTFVLCKCRNREYAGQIVSLSLLAFPLISHLSPSGFVTYLLFGIAK